ncbi:MAG: FkbM family methyltransferase, partial [Vicinamibacterales bacterium]
MYKEIFEDRCYLKHGIRLRDGATVVDIGANIGLFSLFIMDQCRDPQIYAFEPAPAVFDLLRANAKTYGSNVHVVNAGVSRAPGTATFTFYESSSVFSGFHTDDAEDREAIQAIVRNTLLGAVEADENTVSDYVRELTAGRLGQTIHECRVTSVSEIIREHGIEQIDLLKIDAEKSELDIIAGITDADWPKIAQLVVEIHDRTEAAVAQTTDLLTSKGFRCVVEHERLLEHSGLFNVYATREDVTVKEQPLQRTTQDFCAALRSFSTRSSAPLILCLCPGRPEMSADRQAALAAAEASLLSEIGTIPNVHTISSPRTMGPYVPIDYYDQHTHQSSHIPYTPDGYAAIGTALVRAAYNLKSPPCKVLVLDCDNTLWKGVCAEDGPLGVEVTDAYRRLQELVVEQANAGMLVCLCSKNNEIDVISVFAQRTDMVLGLEHVVARRINWDSKSQNIQSLANELNLGLDSFVLIDDNPVECAEVRVNCPEVLTLQLPQDSHLVEPFLRNVWAFDRTAATNEDR